MKDILQNEINRQEYMDLRYRALDEEHNKNDHDHLMESRGDYTTNDESGIKFLEDEFNLEKLKILEELGLRKSEEESIN
jgi:hypothetical protein